MEVTKKVMNDSFSRLQIRLSDIRTNKLMPETEKAKSYVFHHSISDIKEVIFSADFEEAQDSLDFYNGEIDQIISDLPDLLKNITFKDSYPEGIFESTKFISAENEKKNFETYLLEELNYYKTELDSFNKQVIKKGSTLGDRKYANAGMKIGLNLTVEEIGYLFNLLFENGIIMPKPSDGKEVEKKELANFISKNFESKHKKNLSSTNIANSLSFKNIKAQSSILNLLEKLITKVEKEDKK